MLVWPGIYPEGQAIKPASKFNFDDAVEEFFNAFPERRRDTHIFNLSLPEKTLTREMLERLSRLKGGFLPASVIGRLVNHRGPAVGRFYQDDYGEEFCERDIGDYGPPPLTVMMAPGRAPQDKSFSESVLRDYFLSKSSHGAYYRQRNILRIPDEPAFSNDDYWLWHVFDHESAHVLFGHEKAAAPFSARETHFEECVSDVYSLIRHYQRFGADTGFDRAMILSRARLIPDMHTKYARGHMTVAALEAVRALDKDKLMNLEPRDAFALAVQTVEQNHLSHELLNQFADAAVKTARLEPVELVRHYAGSRLPSQLVGDFIDASLALQNHEGLALTAIAAARPNPDIILRP